jgi:3-oxoacyl-[acyl-carrier protein] reductase
MSDMQRSVPPLRGRTAIVTGGSKGIGRAICRALAKDGAAVGVNYRRDAAEAEELVTELTAAGYEAAAFTGSVDVSTDVEMLVGADILVNCAGVVGRSLPVVESGPDALERLMAVNAYGPYRLAQLTIPAMRERGCGHIVMISSTATRTMGANHAPYNMAKAAMEALAFTLAAEEEPYGIRVNVVAPGLVDTDMGRQVAREEHGEAEISRLDRSSPFGRVCRPEDVATVVAFLVGPDAMYVTGQRLAVDGGAERGNRIARPEGAHTAGR